MKLNKEELEVISKALMQWSISFMATPEEVNTIEDLLIRINKEKKYV